MEQTVNAGVKLADLRANQCRFIAGEVDFADTLYCGAPKANGGAWCAEHARIVFKPPPTKDDEDEQETTG
jgi:hypothetical protein